MKSARVLLLITLLNLIGAGTLIAIRQAPRQASTDQRPLLVSSELTLPERPDIKPTGNSERQIKIAQLRTVAFDIAESTVRELASNPGAYCLLAKLHLRSGDVDGARKLWDHSIALAPQFAEAYVDYGHYELKLGAFEKAAAHFRNALKHDPNRIEVYRFLGEALAGQREYASAASGLETYLKENPSADGAWCKLGYVYQQLGKFDQAIASYLKALSVNEHSSEAANGLIVAYRKHGDQKNAQRYVEYLTQLAASEKESFDRASQDPDTIKVKDVLEFISLTAADLLLQAGKVPVAIVQLEKSFAASPDSQLVRSKLLDLYVRSGAVDSAIRLLQLESEAAGNDYRQWLELSTFCIKHRRLTMAETALQKAIALEPDRADAYAVLAQVQMASPSDSSMAVNTAQQAVNLAPSGFHFYVLATAKYHAGDSTGCHAALLKAIELEPDNSEYRDALRRL